ncbi:hypothetical protein T05_4173 [Trichinella murrelli]|uniref:Uncharacterized protein n=1 Tax=Trichinella murrelli TaxID=144512 RepID=A0A0V0T0F6_9BILA|nr:hypothetical protein T05_4173 [Trichinella murrelli]
MPPHIHVVIFYAAVQIKATNDSCMGQQLPNNCNYQTWSEDTISGSKHDVQLPLKPSVSKLIQARGEFITQSASSSRLSDSWPMARLVLCYFS